MKTKQLETEADVINLVGYETPMEFRFATEGTIYYRTMIPKNNCYYDVAFYLGADLENSSDLTFFKHDNFDNFLIKFQIESLSVVNLDGKKLGELYFSQFDKNYNKD